MKNMPRKAAPLSASAIAETPSPRVAEQLQRDERVGGARLDRDERAEQDDGGDEQPEHLGRAPARGVGADHAVDQREQAGGGRAPRRRSRSRARACAPALGHQARRRDQAEQRDRHVDEEDPLPAGRVDEHAAGDDAERAADGGERAPDAERDVALAAGGERDGQERERGGGEQRGADALDRRGRRRACRRTSRSPPASEAAREQREADEEHPAAAEQVAHPAAQQQQAAERERVGVDDPLEAVGGEVEIGLDGRERDVHDRDVEDDHELRDGEHREGEPPELVRFVNHSCCERSCAEPYTVSLNDSRLE